MDKQQILYGLGGLIVGGLGVALVMRTIPSEPIMMNTEPMVKGKSEDVRVIEKIESHNDMSMSAMNKALEGKMGDAFDKAFIELMVEHHQGAIDMANLIDGRAKHDEIKRLGKEIITAQMKEIADMKSWAVKWGYVSTKNDGMMMDH
jgi:uncharacterized protein (DUF305 family)